MDVTRADEGNMNYYHRSLALMAAILVCSFLEAGQSQALQFQGLGSLPGTTFQSIATGISADGSTVVGRAVTSIIDGTDTIEAFQWTAGQGMLGNV